VICRETNTEGRVDLLQYGPKGLLFQRWFSFQGAKYGNSEEIEAIEASGQRSKGGKAIQPLQGWLIWDFDPPGFHPGLLMFDPFRIDLHCIPIL